MVKWVVGGLAVVILGIFWWSRSAGAQSAIASAVAPSNGGGAAGLLPSGNAGGQLIPGAINSALGVVPALAGSVNAHPNVYSPPPKVYSMGLALIGR